ncbi:MAG: transposase [Rhizobiaceae bacterium]|jgi:hypothetical protein
MKPQTRPVIVEVKRKRGIQDRARSIWGGIDLSRAAAEVKAEAGEQHTVHPVDSSTSASDATQENEPNGEQDMADPQEAESAELDVETSAVAETPKSKPRTPRVKKAKAERKPRVARSASKAIASESEAAPVRGKRKTYSKAERAEKVAQIRKLIASGASVKSAVAEAAVSEQTYYQWLKTAAPVAENDDLKDLVALEEENRVLKRRLAEHLRKENAELKRKLGIE